MRKLVYIQKFKIWTFIFIILIAFLSYASEKNQRGPIGFFINLQSMVIPIIQDRDLKGICSIQITLEMDSEESAGQAGRKTVELIDHLYTDMYGLFPVIWHVGQDIDLDALKKRLIRMSNRIIQKNTVKNVLLQNFQIEKARVTYIDP